MVHIALLDSSQGQGSAWIRIISGSWILIRISIREKSWNRIWIRIKVNIQEL
jgi:hypothetical protein